MCGFGHKVKFARTISYSVRRPCQFAAPMTQCPTTILPTQIATRKFHPFFSLPRAIEPDSVTFVFDGMSRLRTNFSPRFNWQVNPNHTSGTDKDVFTARITFLQGKTWVRPILDASILTS